MARNKKLDELIIKAQLDGTMAAAEVLHKDKALYQAAVRRANKQIKDIKKNKMQKRSNAYQIAKQNVLNEQDAEYFNPDPLHYRKGYRKKHNKKYQGNEIAVINFLAAQTSTPKGITITEENRKQNFLYQLQRYASESDEDMQTLIDYLKTIDAHKFGLIIKDYDYMLRANFSRGSGEAFQMIGAHLIARAKEAQQLNAQKVTANLKRELREQQKITLAKTKKDITEEDPVKLQTMTTEEYGKILGLDVRSRVYGKKKGATIEAKDLFELFRKGI